MIRTLLRRIVMVLLLVHLARPAAAQCSTDDQVIDIPDAALAKAILGELNASKPSPVSSVTCADRRLLTRLDASDERIQSIAGLDYFSELESLDLSRNLIRDVRPLAGLVRLKVLHLRDNFIDDITPLLRNIRTPPTRSGILIDIRNNCLDPDSAADADALEALTEFGVALESSGQPRVDCPAP